MHNLGILHCDLRPKNFLVDEYGILKISDFKSARKLPKLPINGDTNKIVGDGTGTVTSPESRGTSAYMSPELFTPEGVYSYSSDFWAVGCVLYELRRGVPPFGWEYSSAALSVSMKELIDRINTAEPVDNPIVFADHSDNRNGNSNAYHSNNNNKDKEAKSADRSYSSRSNVSSNTHQTPAVTPAFSDLLKWLMEKHPSDRCVWYVPLILSSDSYFSECILYSCIMFYSLLLCCIVLYCEVVYCIVLYCFELYCIVLCFIVF